jgi:hypothetical protein
LNVAIRTRPDEDGQVSKKVIEPDQRDQIFEFIKSV